MSLDQRWEAEMTPEDIGVCEQGSKGSPLRGHLDLLETLDSSV